MRTAAFIFLAMTLSSTVWSATRAKSDASAHVEAQALENQLESLFDGTASDWDSFRELSETLADKDQDGYAQLSDKAASLFIDHFGIYAKVAPKLSSNDKVVLANLWTVFPGFLDDTLYRSLADRPSAEEMAGLLDAYEAALTKEGRALIARIPIFDAHFHYYPTDPDRNLYSDPRQVIALLRHNNVKGALLSGVPNEGAVKLHRLAPEMLALEVMPNKQTMNKDYSHSDLYTWPMKRGIFPMIAKWLENRRLRWVGIGEAHVGDDALDASNFRKAMDLAEERGLFVHLHTDVKSITKFVDKVFRMNPNAKVLLAHGGFRGVDAPTPSPTPQEIGALLDQYPGLYLDLAAREDLWQNGRLDAGWRKLLLKYHERVMIGTDPYLRYRWEFYGALLFRMRQWLATLPEEAALNIAYRNGERLFLR